MASSNDQVHPLPAQLESPDPPSHVSRAFTRFRRALGRRVRDGQAEDFYQPPSDAATPAAAPIPIPFPSRSRSRSRSRREHRPTPSVPAVSTASPVSHVFGVELEQALAVASARVITHRRLAAPSCACPDGATLAYPPPTSGPSANGQDDQVVLWGRVPLVVAKLGNLLKTRAVETEGVFRKVGSQRRMRMLQQEFETPPYFGRKLVWEEEPYTVHDAACVLRRYLTSLPQPLVPRHLWLAFRNVVADQAVPTPPSASSLQPHPWLFGRKSSNNEIASVASAENWVATCGGQAMMFSASTGSAGGTAGPSETATPRPTSALATAAWASDVPLAIARFRELIAQCPDPNRHLLLYLLDLLAVFAQRADKNLMNAANLAVIFQPGFFAHPSLLTDPREHQLAVQALEFLIQHQAFFVLDMQPTVSAARASTATSTAGPGGEGRSNGASSSEPSPPQSGSANHNVVYSLPIPPAAPIRANGPTSSTTALAVSAASPSALGATHDYVWPLRVPGSMTAGHVRSSSPHEVAEALPSPHIGRERSASQRTASTHHSEQTSQTRSTRSSLAEPGTAPTSASGSWGRLGAAKLTDEARDDHVPLIQVPSQPEKESQPIAGTQSAHIASAAIPFPTAQPKPLTTSSVRRKPIRATIITATLTPGGGVAPSPPLSAVDKTTGPSSFKPLGGASGASLLGRSQSARQAPKRPAAPPVSASGLDLETLRPAAPEGTSLLRRASSRRRATKANSSKSPIPAVVTEHLVVPEPGPKVHQPSFQPPSGVTVKRSNTAPSRLGRARRYLGLSGFPSKSSRSNSPAVPAMIMESSPTAPLPTSHPAAAHLADPIPANGQSQAQVRRKGTWKTTSWGKGAVAISQPNSFQIQIDYLHHQETPTAV